MGSKISKFYVITSFPDDGIVHQNDLWVIWKEGGGDPKINGNPLNC